MLPADISLWFTTPNHFLLDIMIDAGFTELVMDLEHGVFDPEKTDCFIAYARRAGVKVFAKVQVGGAAPIQQMLDRGVAGIIIPHTEGAAQAAELTAVVKYPPMGTRSFDGGRTVGFGAAAADYFSRSNEDILAIPMIETPQALQELDDILALETVDGIFLGPYDLSLTSGRGAYRGTEADNADLETLAAAVKKAGKFWWMPAWSERERRKVLALGATKLVVGEELGFFHSGLQALKRELEKLT